jgi:hypothetical protein
MKKCTPVAYDVGNGIGPPFHTSDKEKGRRGSPKPAFFNFVRNSRAVQSNIVHFQVQMPYKIA